MKAKRFLLAYSFLRFSTPSQADGDSIRRQTAAAQRWCRANNIRLDTKTTLLHVGSAFSGEHRKNPDRNALAMFLKMIEEGKIPRGSYLIIESFDRLTREHVQAALVLVLTILQAGIRIVQLRPVEMVFDEMSDTLPLIMMIVELSRGNSESEVKSVRMLECWSEKKQLARQRGTPMTRNIPSWLTLSADGQFAPIEDRAKAVLEIFSLCLCGLGTYAIARKLNREGVPAIGRSGKWTRRFILSILRDGRVKGKHQPYFRSKRSKIAQEPIPDYFPAIVDEATWNQAQKCLDRRRVHRGASAERINLFHGLLRDAIHGGKFWVSMAGGSDPKKRYRHLVNDSSYERGKKFCSFNYDVFESLILGQLEEIDARTITAGKPRKSRLASLVKEYDQTVKQIAKIEEKIESGADLDSLVRVLERLEKKKRGLTEDIASERMIVENPIEETWPTAQDAMREILKLPGSDDRKLQLRSLLQKTVESIWLVLASAPSGIERYCVAQVFFLAAGSLSQTFILGYRRPCTSHGVRTGRLVLSDDWTKWARGYKRTDLRNRQDAVDAKLLLESSSSALARAVGWRQIP